MIPSLAIYFSLFASSFLSSTIFPLAPDPLLGYMVSKGYNLLLVVGIAVTGSYLGSCTTYFLGYLGREKIIKKRMNGEEKKIDKYHQIFERYGAPVLLFSWVPIAGDIFVALAGVVEMNFWKFSLYAITGKILRFAFVAYIGSRINL